MAKLEQGVQEPTWPTVLALADALGVSCLAFFADGVAPAESRGPGRPRKARVAAEQPAAKRGPRGGGPAVAGLAAGTPATDQQAVPPSGMSGAGEPPPAQHKPKARRTPKPRG